MMTSNLDSLIQFRYQKKVNSNDKVHSKSDNVNSNGITSNASDDKDVDETDNLSGDVEVIFETPEKKTTYFLTEKQDVQVVENSDSESVNSTSTSSSVSMKKDSPWLFKGQKILNSEAKKKPTQNHSKRVLPSMSSDEEESQTRPPVSKGYIISRKACEKRIEQLQELFPTQPHKILRQAVKSTSNLEEAADELLLICDKDIESTSNTSQESVKVGPRPYKRIRLISVSSDEASNDNQLQGATPGSEDVSNMSEFSDINQKRLNFLMEVMPHHSKEELKDKLVSCDFDVEKAMDQINTCDDKKEMIDNIPGNSDVTSANCINDLKMKLKNRITSLGRSDTPDSDDSDTVSERFVVNSKKNERKYRKKVEDLDDDDDDDEEFDSGDESDEDVIAKDTALQNVILNFFNEASNDEYAAMPNCSMKKAEVIIALRPFKNYYDLKEKIHSCKSVSINMIDGCREMIRYRNEVINLMKSCEKISTDIQADVDDLMIKTDLEGKDAEIVIQPKLLNPECSLKPYQMVGLNWLALMHRRKLNAILADEMGLGKTIQAIAFLAHLLENGDTGPHIIIVPSSTLDNWSREISRWCPDLKIIMYYGNQEERAMLRAQIIEDDFESINLILTTYNMATGHLDDRKMFRRYTFHHGVLDEAHMLKNVVSLRYKNLLKIKIKRRLLLTGTPLQNNLVELMSLLAFVMPKMFANIQDELPKVFSMFSRTGANDRARGNYEQERLQHAKSIMKPFVLRRQKFQVLKQLPSKIEEILKCSMTPDQRLGYDSLVKSVSKQYRDHRDGDKQQNTNHVVMQLRKWANHPMLHRTHFHSEKLREMAKLMKTRDPGHYDAVEEYIFQDMEVMSDFELHKTCLAYPCLKNFKLETDVICQSGKFYNLDEILPVMKEKGDRVLIFSQFTMMMDIMEKYMEFRKHKFCRLDGSTPVSERQKLIDRFNNDPEIFIFLLSTRAGGLGINLTSANRVILHDIDYNPYNDKQAEDRCHRVGQTREVTITRLIVKDSIEEGMLKCQEFKLNLERDLTGQSEDGDGDSVDVAKLLKDVLANAGL